MYYTFREMFVFREISKFLLFVTFSRREYANKFSIILFLINEKEQFRESSIAKAICLLLLPFVIAAFATQKMFSQQDKEDSVHILLWKI